MTEERQQKQGNRETKQLTDSGAWNEGVKLKRVSVFAAQLCLRMIEMRA